MRIIVTRPEEDASPLAAQLAARGHDVVLAPLMAIVFADDATVTLDGVQGVLATSANGARALARATQRRDMPVFAVGDATAKAARAAGFTEVESADGDVDALAALVAARVDPKAGALLHAAGSVTAGDLAGQLSAKGYTVRRAVLYRAKPVGVLPEAASEALRDGSADAVLFYSPRSARLFLALAALAGLGARLKDLHAFCLSPAVAEIARAAGFARLLIAPAPTQEALLACLDADGVTGLPQSQV